MDPSLGSKVKRGTGDSGIDTDVLSINCSETSNLGPEDLVGFNNWTSGFVMMLVSLLLMTELSFLLCVLFVNLFVTMRNSFRAIASARSGLVI